MTDDPYGSDVLAGFTHRQPVKAATVVAAELDLVLEDAASGFVGAITRIDRSFVELEDRHGKSRTFPFDADLLLEGERIRLSAPVREQTTARTASGSFAVADARARVALPSRIFVEGRHDAELVERVWGDDLRVEGVVVEYLEGVDLLEGVLRDFRPAAGRRVGVLVDHLVPGSKESRIADAVARGPFGPHVLVVGHPFIDVWQAVKPDCLGMAAWPVIPREVEWKHGVCAALGWPHSDQADIAAAWKRILSRVRSFADLEPALLGRVEQLIDFVTTPVSS